MKMGMMGMMDFFITNGTSQVLEEEEEPARSKRASGYEDGYDGYDGFDGYGYDEKSEDYYYTYEDGQDDVLEALYDPNRIAGDFDGPLPSSIEVEVAVRYDLTLLAYFKGNKTLTKNWLTNVLNLAKPRLAHPSLKVQINLKLDSIDSEDRYIDASILSQELAILEETRKRESLVFTYFGLALGSGLHGIARIGSLCHSKIQPVTITELFRKKLSELSSAKTFAH